MMVKAIRRSDHWTHLTRYSLDEMWAGYVFGVNGIEDVPVELHAHRGDARKLRELNERSHEWEWFPDDPEVRIQTIWEWDRCLG